MSEFGVMVGVLLMASRAVFAERFLLLVKVGMRVFGVVLGVLLMTSCTVFAEGFRLGRRRRRGERRRRHGEGLVRTFARFGRFFFLVIHPIERSALFHGLNSRLSWSRRRGSGVGDRNRELIVVHQNREGIAIV